MKRHAKSIVGVVLSVLLLAWVLRDVSLEEVVREVSHADPLLFAAALVVTLATFAFRAVRWGILLRPVAPGLPFRPRYAAVMIGFAVNNLLPARVGEFARAFALARSTRVPTAAAFASLVVERILDALILVGLLFAVMSSEGFPVVREVAGVDPRDAARLVAVAMAGVGVVLFLMVVAPARSMRVAEATLGRLPGALARPLLHAAASFVEGLGALRSGSLFAASLLLALGQWLTGAWSLHLAFRAFGIDEVPFATSVFLQSLIALAVAIPSSPGFFGPFEAAAKLGLGLWGVPAEKAVPWAVGFHLGGFIPVTLIGLYYVWRLNLRWSEVQHSEEVVEERVEAAAGAATPAEEAAHGG